jgi:subtilisin-like proprotein convertase family protein
MNPKPKFLVMIVLMVVALLLPILALAQTVMPTAPDSAETLEEQTLAWAAEQEILTAILPAASVNQLDFQYPLFIGVDDVTIPTYQIDPLTNNTIEAFSGFQVWGAAFDEINNILYFNNGATLYEWPVGGTINTLGTIVDEGATTQSMVSLAAYGGHLYGTKNIANEAVYMIDLDTLVATVYIDYEDADYDLGGLAVDQTTGQLYATNDDVTPHGSGLFRINMNGTGTLIAPYPDGQTDIDGLSIGIDGRAYLVTDEPGSIYVYDLATAVYLTPLTNPWTTSEVFSAGAWIWQRPYTSCITNPINMAGSGPASPFPSIINITGFNNPLADVNIHLLGVNHTWPDDMDILLEGPAGQNLILMSDTGGSLDIANLTLTFDDAAPTLLPDSTQIESGSYQPTNFVLGDTFLAPAPTPSDATTLATFNNTDPNGVWKLYIQDDTSGDIGTIARGWCLEITEAPPAIVVNPAQVNQKQPLDTIETQMITITNSGDGSLLWNITENHVGAFFPAESVTDDAPFTFANSPQASPGSNSAVTNLSDLAASGEAARPLPTTAATPTISYTPFVPTDTISNVLYYKDRALFDSVFPGLPVEDFENGLWADAGVTSCPAPFDALTNNTCFAPGGILPGIRFQDNPLNESGGGSPNGLVGVGAGIYGSISKNIVANSFNDSFEIYFDPPVNAVGMDVTHFTLNDVAVQIVLYDAIVNAPIATSSVIARNDGSFWGVYSPVPIGRIELHSHLRSIDGAEGVDNVAFGAIGDCSLLTNTPWLMTPVTNGDVPGGGSSAMEVGFDSTGLALGEYTATLCLNSNDPLRPLLEIPVSFTVTQHMISLPMVVKP